MRRRARVSLLPLVAAAVLAMPTPAPAEPREVEGSIAVPTPFSVTEFVFANTCPFADDPFPLVLQGLDGYLIDISGHVGAATLAPTGQFGFLADFDAYFYDRNCVLVTHQDGFAEGSIGATEEGRILPAARWAVVVYYLGPPNATFVFTF